MADDDGELKYYFVTENGEKKTMSIGYTGKGQAYYPNAEFYDGDFAEGIRDGRGKYNYKNGNVFEGEWRSNLKHGIGKMIYNRHGEYQGYWENGRRHGEGVFNYPNGDIYSGWWKFGEKEGTATYLFKETGMKIQGQWTQGQIKCGKWIYPNGTYFEGDFENNKPKGMGVWHFKNGNVLEGEYEHKAKGEDDEEEEPAAEEEEGEEDESMPKVVKPKFDLVWHSNTNIAQSAAFVNSVEQ
jgi:hypothetical protein